MLPEDGVAVVNTDDPKGLELFDFAVARGQKVIRIGHDAGCEMRLERAALRCRGAGRALHLGRSSCCWSACRLIGGFQAMNVLTAAALVIACGAEPAEVFAVLPKLTTVRGRMQLAATRTNGATVFVDYAHTPDAVETALKALRPHVLGRLVAIVGAGGDRDRTKRPLMGRAATAFADHVIVTADSPAAPRTRLPSALR